ncbi:MAG: proton-dependent oligopeptide transporter, family [Thermoplasmata archaeon]|nr:proton-dependent oligopeptide transporter, family [Thermoplasmata archaeon]
MRGPPHAGAMAQGAVERFRPGPFIAVNAIELLERLAYYGVVSVASLYMASLGYSAGVIGPFLALLLPLPYLVNLVVGPLADRHGYRPALLVAFAVYTAGFLLMGLFTALWALLTGIVLVGVGAGIFKPVPAATIALTTTEAQRNLGFSVYYWAINLGAFLGPVLIASFLRDYRAAFYLAAAFTAVNFALALLVYRDPRPPQARAGELGAVRTLLDILRDTRFLLLLLVFSGFWFVYSLNFSYAAIYLADFVPLPACAAGFHFPPCFTPNLQQSIDPAVVILASLPLGALVSARRWPPLPVMTAGIAVMSAGFAIVGFSTSWPLYVAGIVVMATGEILAYPGFLSLVSRLAPPGKAAAYQSAGFLPIGIGFFLGPIVNGFLYEAVAQGALRPRLFWAIECAVGLLTVAGFLLVVRLPGNVEEAPRRRRAPALAGLAVLAAALLVVAGWAGGTTVRLGTAAAADTGGTVAGHWTGTLSEGASVDQAILVPAGPARNLTLALGWSDEATGPLPGTSNGPDHFHLELRNGNVPLGAADGSNPPGSFGRLAIRVQVPASAVAVTWTARITLVDAGDVVAGPATVGADTGNAWTLDARTHA